jgi:hypothetical protein
MIGPISACDQPDMTWTIRALGPDDLAAAHALRRRVACIARSAMQGRCAPRHGLSRLSLRDNRATSLD